VAWLLIQLVNKVLPLLTLPNWAGTLVLGEPERALDRYEENAAGGLYNLADISLLWHPSYAPVRKMERFKTFMRKANFVEYWRAKGWPEQCHPTTADDFECS
jgi:hypothetical protein